MPDRLQGRATIRIELGNLATSRPVTGWFDKHISRRERHMTNRAPVYGLGFRFLSVFVKILNASFIDGNWFSALN